MHTITGTLKPRHHEIIRLAFLGRSNVEIAGAVGLTPGAIACIVRSPIVQAELARMQEKAYEKTVNTPLRVQLMSELNGAGTEALRLNRKLMNNEYVDAKLRAKLGMHFLDRVIFNKDVDEGGEGSYRDILRKLDDIGRNVNITIQQGVQVSTPSPAEGVS